MNSTFFLIWIAAVLSAVAVNAQDSVQDAIDREVWQPFTEAYQGLDDEKLLALLDEDFLRIDRDGQYIIYGGESRESIGRSITEARARNLVRTIDLNFVERFHTGELAFESGYYRTTIAEGGQAHVIYGYFTVVLRKVDGRWKILADTTTTYDGQITESDFVKGTPFRPVSK